MTTQTHPETERTPAERSGRFLVSKEAQRVNQSGSGEQRWSARRRPPRGAFGEFGHRGSASRFKPADWNCFDEKKTHTRPFESHRWAPRRSVRRETEPRGGRKRGRACEREGSKRCVQEAEMRRPASHPERRRDQNRYVVLINWWGGKWPRGTREHTYLVTWSFFNELMGTKSVAVDFTIQFPSNWGKIRQFFAFGNVTSEATQFDLEIRESGP